MVEHPAKFSEPILKVLSTYVLDDDLVLDPFGGTGRVKMVNDMARIISIEIEPEWAHDDPGSDVVADATVLPFYDSTFDSIVTSPCYGNRMADHHNARDGSKRITYTHCLGRKLHANNSGQLQWGPKYRSLHFIAWQEAIRVLKPGGLFVLNISDHIRDGEIQPVSEWHYGTLLNLGLIPIATRKIKTPRMRRGRNGEKRVPEEMVYVLGKRMIGGTFEFPIKFPIKG